jgi:riboflavin kinase / FMN adenylyltransferase
LKTEYLKPLCKIADNSAVTVGSFDGLHRGHIVLLNKLLDTAKEKNLIPVAVTFDPHPRKTLDNPDFKLLTPLDEKISAFEKTGIELLAVVEFDRVFASLNAEDFIEKYLIGSLGMKSLVVGEDHNFGVERRGNAGSLRDFSGIFGFDFTVVSPFLHNGTIVKSGVIRSAISSGKMLFANDMLGKPYSLNGEIVRGKGDGKRLGFPTANLKVSGDKLLPKNGVFIALDDENVAGLLYIGERKTLASGFAIEFHRSVPREYSIGSKLEISIFDRIRDDIRFDTEAELVSRIKKDFDEMSEWIKNRK